MPAMFKWIDKDLDRYHILYVYTYVPTIVVLTITPRYQPTYLGTLLYLRYVPRSTYLPR